METILNIFNQLREEHFSLIEKGMSFICKKIKGNKGIYIMNESWDNLIILDACRYDIFDNLNTIKGDLKCRFSRGLNTNQFLRENFGNKYFDDTIYIIANPLFNFHGYDKNFYKTVNMWDFAWDEKLRTVLPGQMAKKTNEIRRDYPNKRIISHFVQPHFPFIGEIGQKYLPKHRAFEMDKEDVKRGIEREQEYENIWKLVEEKKVNRETVIKAYKENLEITLPIIKDLVNIIEGKTVITSDHGNLIGERIFPFFFRRYGHPGLYHENVVKVPWFIVNND